MHINDNMKSILTTFLGRWILLCLVLFGRLALADNTIGVDDVLRIGVYGYDDLKTETRVSSNGRITFPMVGELQVAGKSTFKAEQLIANALSKGGFIQDAHVSVIILENNSQRVSVLGHVNAPGRYPLDSVTTLIDVIAMAGGIRDTGEEKVIITRYENGQAHKQEIDLHEQLSISENPKHFEIQQGDVIYVPKAPMFYIYGEVQHPGEFPVEKDISVAKALSIGGGLTPRGTQNDIIIKRKDTQGKVHELEARLSKYGNFSHILIPRIYDFG